MATACGVQKTYLSRVLNSTDAHLSEEQLYHASMYLGMPKDEREFLQLLRRRDRATARALQDELDHDIERVRQHHRKTDQYIKVKPRDQKDRRPTATAGWDPFYTDPLNLLTHVFLTVERFRKDLPALASALRIDMDRLTRVLTTLEAQGLIRLVDDQLMLLKRDTHLPSDSPVSYTHLTLPTINWV